MTPGRESEGGPAAQHRKHTDRLRGDDLKTYLVPGAEHIHLGDKRQRCVREDALGITNVYDNVLITLAENKIVEGFMGPIRGPPVELRSPNDYANFPR
jgi:hypothetical protein